MYFFWINRFAFSLLKCSESFEGKFFDPKEYVFGLCLSFLWLLCIRWMLQYCNILIVWWMCIAVGLGFFGLFRERLVPFYSVWSVCWDRAICSDILRHITIWWNIPRTCNVPMMPIINKRWLNSSILIRWIINRTRSKN